MTARIRADLDAIPGYVPGRTVPGAIKLASNETTFGPLPSVAQAVAEAVATANRYPDNRSTDLVAAVAAHVGVAPEHVAIGCGSVAICQELVQITCLAPTDEVLFGWRSFEAYPIVTRVGGAVAVRVPLTGETNGTSEDVPGTVHDLDAMAAAITPNTRLIFVCNPNNPTSTVVVPAELARFVEAVPDDVLVVIDEAYVEYIRDGLLPDSLALVRKHANVVVLRTFSKAYGLAGARVGYAVGDPDIITALGKVYVPFTVSSLAQAAAIASLDVSGELLARTDAVVAERVRASTRLRDLGYALPDSQANFVWLPLGPDRTADFVERAADARILVRPYGADGVRVTIGAPDENDALLAFSAHWIGAR